MSGRDQQREPPCLHCPGEHPPTPAPCLASIGPACRHVCLQLIAKSPTTAGLTSSQHTYREAIPHLSSGHQQATPKASQLAKGAKAVTVLQRKLCTPLPTGKGTSSPHLHFVSIFSWDGSSAIPATLPGDLAAAASVAATGPHVHPLAPCNLNAPP